MSKVLLSVCCLAFNHDNYIRKCLEGFVMQKTDFEFENNNTLRANIGFHFQIAILALQANYTFSDYHIATIGVGISVR